MLKVLYLAIWSLFDPLAAKEMNDRLTAGEIDRITLLILFVGLAAILLL